MFEQLIQSVINSPLQSFVALVLIFVALIFFMALFYKDDKAIMKLLGLLLICSLCLFANSPWIYFPTIFIIATVVTEISFLQILAAIIRGDKNFFDYLKATQGQASLEQSKALETDSKSKKRSPMEYMILNTLWTKQVNRWPDLSMFWTFTMNFVTPSEKQTYREAGAKLKGEGLITEAENGHYLLTISGFNYCKNNYKEFPQEQWWPEEQINKEQLAKAVKDVI